MQTRRLTALALVLAASTAMAGCSTVSKINPFHGSDKNKAVASQGERISIIAFDQKLEVADTLKGAEFYLPDPQPIADWPLPGGTPEQSVEHVQAAQNFTVAWTRGFGAGDNRRRHVTAPPVAEGGRVYVMDGEALVSALDAGSGREVWRANLKLKSKRDNEAFGGGLAVADGKVYVASGYRFVAALDAATGKELWRTPVSAPIHAAPTVSGGKVIVVSTDNELQTFDAATGRPDWTYQALIEPARILAASSPAVSNGTVVASLASGELIALQAANGNDLWAQALSRASRTNALSEIRDIPGRPVIYKGDVFAVSHSGVFAAIDLRTGAPRWSLPVVGITTPWAAGDVVYVVSKAGEVICVSRENGQVYWITELNKKPGAGKNGKTKKVKPKDVALYSGPILASNRLIVVSTKGEAVALNPKTGAIEKTIRVGGPALISPIAANGTVYVVNEKAELVAIR